MNDEKRMHIALLSKFSGASLRFYNQLKDSGVPIKTVFVDNSDVRSLVVEKIQYVPTLIVVNIGKNSIEKFEGEKAFAKLEHFQSIPRESEISRREKVTGELVSSIKESREKKESVLETAKRLQHEHETETTNRQTVQQNGTFGQEND
jgi:DNA polymerase III alpha subunit